MSGIDNLTLRLTHAGGDALGRIQKGKLRSLEAALRNSYQSALITTDDGTEYQCLINPDKIVPDYDNKVISITNDAGLAAGDIVHWSANNTHWIVYMPELTETAYFRAALRRCRYKIPINGVDYYVYIKGPTESDAKWNQGTFSWNSLNYSLSMYVTKTTDSLDLFKRFNTIKLEGQTWQVVATDNISIEGLIEVSLKEFFENSMEDLQTTPEVIPVDVNLPHIVGETFVKPYDIETYTIALTTGGTWSVSNTLATILSSNDETATVEIVSGRSGSFNLIYSVFGDPDVVLQITIESL